MILILLSTLFLGATCALNPFVVLPSHFLGNANNTFYVTPIKAKNENVGIHATIICTNTKRVLYNHKFKAKRAGHPLSISFPIKQQCSSADIRLQIPGHADYKARIKVQPDVHIIYVNTDKYIYKPTDIVNIRALPLTSSGQIYEGDVEYALVNPDNFELRREVSRAKAGYSSLTMMLPEHLTVGEWRIIARPAGDRQTNSEFDVTFLVKEYVLPPFRIFASIADSEALNNTTVSLDVRYFHGLSISGTVSISCSPANLTTNPRTPLLQAEVVNGSWTSHVDFSTCFDAITTPTTVFFEIREAGAGQKGETHLRFDPLAPSFDLLPLRLFFNKHTSKIYLATRGRSLAAPADLHVSFQCFGPRTDHKTPRVLSAKTESLITFENPSTWDTCNVIAVEVSRYLSVGRSRPQTIFLPNLDTSSLTASVIDLQNPKVSYGVGEVLVVHFNTSETTSMNYLVLCSQMVVAIGTVREDLKLSIPLTRNMIGRCVLFAYSTDMTVDMVQFHVDDRCEASSTGSPSEIRPGDKLTMNLHGSSHGYALLRAIDQRLSSFATSSSRLWPWDMTMFNREDNKNNQARLHNFLKIKKIKQSLESSCSTAGYLYLSYMGECPTARSTAFSPISNYCLRIIIENCLHPPNMTVSRLCDKNSGRNCPPPLQSRIPFIAKSAFGNSFSVKNTQHEQFSDVPEGNSDDLPVQVREHFHDIWFFDAVNLDADGKATVELPSPDNIGTWQVTSSYWHPGQTSICQAPDISIVAVKDIFLYVDMPRHVYQNESIAAKILVTANNITEEMSFSVCVSELSRRICADEGPKNGQDAKNAYNRVTLSPSNRVVTKTLPMRFLTLGQTTVLFKLRKEGSFPGVHHCELGDIVDAVRINLEIAKRADTEEHYKTLVLDSEKLLTKIMLNDDASNTIDVEPFTFDVSERRVPEGLETTVQAQLHHSEAVHAFVIDIARFLPYTVLDLSESRRSKRSIENIFLTDVLKRLSRDVYNFKIAQLSQKPKSISIIENYVSNGISDMLRFSDCTGNSSNCGFSNTERTSEFEPSIVLTALSTSLLCTANVDENLVCGALGHIKHFLKKRNFKNIDFHYLTQFESQEDSKWFLLSMILQISRDCNDYKCIKDPQWKWLYKEFLDVDEDAGFDSRVLAAMAAMGPNGTSEILRIKLQQNRRDGEVPFWTAGRPRKTKTKEAFYDIVRRVQRGKSGDVLVNSLGILSFVPSGAEGTVVDWDPLAAWLQEQRRQDETFGNAMDTYFASRALFEYKSRKVPRKESNNLQVTVSCEAMETRTVNVTETAVEIHLPSATREVVFTTKGKGKARASIRIISAKRLRSRRGLSNDDYYPVQMNVEQNVTGSSILQTVCLTVLTPLITTLELTHGIFTGYSISPGHIVLLQNSTNIRIHSVPTVSSFAVHFVLEGFDGTRRTACYVAALMEPTHNHEPINLAPIAVFARHPVQDVVGLVLLSHPDQKLRKRRHSAKNLQLYSHPLHRSRRKRSIFDEAIDTVCFQGGHCLCAETSCDIKCGRCSDDTDETIEKLLNKEDFFGVLAEVESSRQEFVDNGEFTVLQLSAKLKAGNAKGVVADDLEVWLRSCNIHCGSWWSQNEKLLLVGQASALTVDDAGRQHYVLRNMDRLEKSKDCEVLSLALLQN